MATTDQILYGLAALLGQMVGRMPSPEFFVPVLIAGYYARKAWHLIVFPAPCALLGTFAFVTITGATRYAVADFTVRYLGSFLVIALFVTWHRFRRSKPPEADGNGGDSPAQKNATSNCLSNRILGKPEWLHHEGVWRLMQVLRLGLPIFFAAAGIPAVMSDSLPKWENYLVYVFLVVPITFFAVHASFRVVFWVIQGFSKNNHNAQQHRE